MGEIYTHVYMHVFIRQQHSDENCKSFLALKMTLNTCITRTLTRWISFPRVKILWRHDRIYELVFKIICNWSLKSENVTLLVIRIIGISENFGVGDVPKFPNNDENHKARAKFYCLWLPLEECPKLEEFRICSFFGCDGMEWNGDIPFL